jgi:hypothetical protein
MVRLMVIKVVRLLVTNEMLFDLVSPLSMSSRFLDQCRRCQTGGCRHADSPPSPTAMHDVWRVELSTTIYTSTSQGPTCRINILLSFPLMHDRFWIAFSSQVTQGSLKLVSTHVLFFLSHSALAPRYIFFFSALHVWIGGVEGAVSQVNESDQNCLRPSK